MALSVRQELALELAFAAGEPLGRQEVRNGPAGEAERGFVVSLAAVECDLLEREWEALERWSAWLVGAIAIEDPLVRAQLCQDCERLGWDQLAPTGAY